MSMVKNLLAMLLMMVASSFALDTPMGDVSNVCDTLPSAENPQVVLRLSNVFETLWFGDKDLSKSDSVKHATYTDYTELSPQRNFFTYQLPVSIKAGCSETQNNTFYFGEWNKDEKSWSLNDENDDYATYIMDIRGNRMDGFDSTNAYNILAMKKGGLPQDGAYTSGELLVSKSYDFQFDWWFASVMIVIENRNVSINEKKDTVTTVSYSYKYASSMGMDSLNVVNTAMSNLTIPDSIGKVSLQVFHAVLMDSTKIKVEDKDEDNPTALVNVGVSPAEGKRVEVRRLDGSRVKKGETLSPGVYYVKYSNGIWKKEGIR